MAIKNDKPERERKLVEWLLIEIRKAQDAGQEMFMGIPDAWIEKHLRCCQNGHIMTAYVKSELHGPICGCGMPSHIFPDWGTQEHLDEALK